MLVKGHPGLDVLNSLSRQTSQMITVSPIMTLICAIEFLKMTIYVS